MRTLRCKKLGEPRSITRDRCRSRCPIDLGHWINVCPEERWKATNHTTLASETRPTSTCLHRICIRLQDDASVSLSWKQSSDRVLEIRGEIWMPVTWSLLLISTEVTSPEYYMPKEGPSISKSYTFSNKRVKIRNLDEIRIEFLAKLTLPL